MKTGRHVFMFAVAQIAAVLLGQGALEALLARLECSGLVPLAEPLREIAADWIAAYNRFVVGE